MTGRSALGDARALLAGARNVVVLTGAGISAESGVPTFRGEEGLWKSFRPEDLATPESFRRDPRLVWEWYAWRRERVGRCVPNQGHLALARWALAGRATIVTQNVDGLHEAAARSEAGDRDPTRALPLELHGALFRDRCTRCVRRFPASASVDASSLETLPRCPECGALARPDVVWFGELLDATALGRAFDEAGGADVCLVVGTSALVHPAASIPLITLKRGGLVVEVNPDLTPISAYARISVRAPAAEALPTLLT